MVLPRRSAALATALAAALLAPHAAALSPAKSATDSERVGLESGDAGSKLLAAKKNHSITFWQAHNSKSVQLDERGRLDDEWLKALLDPAIAWPSESSEAMMGLKVNRMPQMASHTLALKTFFTVMAAVVLVLMYRYTHETIAEYTGLQVEHMCCIAYVSLTVAIDLSIKHAAWKYGGSFPFDPACVVVVVEYMKGILSLLLFIAHVFQAVRSGEELTVPRRRDIMWMAVPALIYALCNLVVFQAIRTAPLPTFAVVRETSLVWSALLWMLVFQRRISAIHWLGIGGIVTGIGLAHVTVITGATDNPSGVLWTSLLALMNGAGSVANEYAMKRRASLDINLQNCLLYFMCGTFVLTGISVSRPHAVQGASAFLTGFGPECWQIVVLQVFAGLAMSRILKHIEAVTKALVSALRGPGIILIGALMFRTQLAANQAAAALVVCASCWLYLSQGPLDKTFAPWRFAPSRPRALAETRAASAPALNTLDQAMDTNKE